MKNDRRLYYPKRAMEILRGETPVITVGYQATGSFHTHRKIGEIWTDSQGNTWEQKNGYKSKITRLDEARTPLFCPNCGRIMKKRHDTKMFYRFNMCFDCVIERDTQMKINGTFKDFEKTSILQSHRSMLLDAIQAIEEHLNNLSDTTSYVTEESGKLENWKGDVEKEREFFTQELSDAKEQLRQIEEGEVDTILYGSSSGEY